MAKKQDGPKSRNSKPGFWFFKLFNSIKEEHEVDFAELELRSLVGPVERVRNFVDLIETTPLKHFTSDSVRIQDVLTYEPCYGPYQGFMVVLENTPGIATLVRRLAYTREIIGVLEGVNAEEFLKTHLPGRKVGNGVSFSVAGDYVLLRLITNQYYLEKSQYVSKLSRNEAEVRDNVKLLIEYPFKQLYRIPASATMSVGKRLEDYFTIREESSLYLTHMLHPYKGKFHPKMVRALLNYVMPNDEGKAMDNFAGSGTLLLEASLMGLNSIGVEINPLSVLMSSVKTQSLATEVEKLREGIMTFLKAVSSTSEEYQTVSSGDTLLVQPRFDPHKVAARVAEVPKLVAQDFPAKELVQEFILAHQILERLEVDDGVRKFLLLGLCGTISDLARRTTQRFADVLSARLSWMYLRVFLFQELDKYLGISLGHSATYVGDTRNMRRCWALDGKQASVGDSSIDAIVNSPPYSTALDYIRNDLPQLTILGLSPSLKNLEQDMMGNPNLRLYPERLLEEMSEHNPEFKRLPPDAKTVIERLVTHGRNREAIRTFKFFNDMYRSLTEMKRVLKPGEKAVIIIGNNHYKLDGDYMEVKNDEIVAKMAEDAGFSRDTGLPLQKSQPLGEDAFEDIDGGIRRWLEKSMSGMIRYETVLILEKPLSR